MASNARRHARTRVLRACAALAGVLLLDAAVADAVIRWDSVGPPGRRALLPADASGLRDLGSQVGSVAVDPADGRRVYAATSDGLFVSSNGGESWTFADAGAATPAHLGIGKVVIDPHTPTTLYVPTCCGLQKSTDGGATFQPTSLAVEVLDLAIDATTPTTLWAVPVSGGRLFRTVDGGANWTRLDAAPTAGISIAYGGPSALYLATGDGSGVFKSEDGGDTWNPTALTGSVVTYVTTPPDDPLTVYASAGGNGFQKSQNGGASWSPVALPATGNVVALAFEPGDPSVVYAILTPPRVLRSPDGASSWDDVNDGLPTEFAFTSIAVGAVDPTALYVGTNGRAVAKSVDGGATWNSLGVDVSTVTLVTVHPLRPRTVFVQNESGFFRTTDGGTTWTSPTLDESLHPPDIRALAFDPHDPLVVYAAVQNAPPYESSALIVLKSMDTGATWNPTSALPAALGAAAIALAIDPQTATLYAGTTAGGGSLPHLGEVFRSPDGGTTWPFEVTFPPHGLMTLPVALAADPQHAGGLYAGTYKGVWASSDASVTWAALGEGLEDRLVSSLAVDPSSTVYATTERVVFNSMGGGYFPGESTGVARRPEGGAWVPANEGLPSLDVNALALDPVAPSVLYAATAAGVASTRNGAGHWERAGLDLAATVIAVDGTEPRTVYAGTAGRGLFRAEVIECTGAGDCDDGDPCSADVCDPSNGLADVNGCVRDRTGFAAIACLVRGTSDDLPCADLLPARAKRRIAQDLTRASRLIEKAGSRARSRRLGRATALVRGAKRLVLRVADREGGPGTPGQQCFQFLDDVLESFVGQVRALRSR